MRWPRSEWRQRHDARVLLQLRPDVKLLAINGLVAKGPGITAEKILAIANGAKAGCPISRLLKAEISLDAKLG